MKRTLSRLSTTQQVMEREPTKERVEVEVRPCVKSAACMTPRELLMPLNQNVKSALARRLLQLTCCASLLDAVLCFYSMLGCRRYVSRRYVMLILASFCFLQ